jgi:hypothetical protein
MALCLFGNHISRWQAGCKEGSKKCMVCHNTLNKPAHHTKDCPILKQLGLKLVKHTPADGGDAASQVSETPAPAPAPTPPVPPVPPSADGGSSCTPGAFTVVTKVESYDSKEDFNYKSKYEGSVYCGKSKSNVSIYPHASHATAEPSNNVSPPAISQLAMTSCRRSTSSINPRGLRTVQLPKLVIALLQNPPSHSTAFISDKFRPGHNSLLVADTGATDHMVPDKSAFISYWTITGCRVRMGNNSFAPILGSGSAVIALNGKHILIRDCLHVPALRNPLYSLCAHQCQHGCGFIRIGMHGLGMYVFFPSFIVKVDTATNCHLSYAPIGRTSTLSFMDYVQPIQTHTSASTTAVIPPASPAVI